MTKRIIFIGGATASGKSELGVNIAKEIGGEIISADSRQVYKNIPYFTGAILKDEMKGVIHHLLSFLSEEKIFSVGEFQKKAEEKIKEICKKGKIPIIVGGSSFYFEPLIYKNLFPEVSQNKELRNELKEKSIEELFQILQKKDKRRAEFIDKKNKPRLIRAIEITEELGLVPELKKEMRGDYEIFFIWLSQPIENQREKIAKNVEKRMGQGLLKEAEIVNKNLLKVLSPKEVKERFIKLGQAFKYIHDLWNEKINLDEFIEKIKVEEGRYAKRQNTYLKKFFSELPKQILKVQYDLLDKNYQKQALKDTKNFLK